MNKLIKDTLKPLNIPINYAGRFSQDFPLIVFHTIEDVQYYQDGTDSNVTKYTVTLNIYCPANQLIELEKKVKKLMLQNKFIYVYSASTYYDTDLKVYIKALQFEKVIEENY